MHFRRGSGSLQFHAVAATDSLPKSLFPMPYVNDPFFCIQLRPSHSFFRALRLFPKMDDMVGKMYNFGGIEGDICKIGKINFDALDRIESVKGVLLYLEKYGKWIKRTG